MKRKNNRLQKAFDGVIRPARADDLPGLMVIENACFTTEAYEEDQMDESLQASIDNPRNPFLLAFTRAAANDNGLPGAYAFGGMEDDQTGYVEGIAVMEELRNQRLGRILLDRVCASLREAGAQRIKLDVRTENAPAIHLYETFGFIKTQDKPDFYGKGENAIEMVRTYSDPAPR